MQRHLPSAVLAGSLAAYLLLPAPAAHATHTASAPTPRTIAHSPALQKVDIAVTPEGFTAPSVLRSGAITFHVRSADPAGSWIGLVRLRPGVSLKTYLADLRRAMGDAPVTGGRAVALDAEMLGGAAVAHAPAAATLNVAPGTYHLVDFQDLGLPDLADRVRRVTVLPGRPAAASRPRAADPTSRITLRDGGFDAPGVLTGPVRVVNRSRQHNEAMLMPVRPGTTLADLDSFFGAVDAGHDPGGSPFTGGPTGVVPLSPGRSAVLRTELPSGTYALVSWVRDLDSGRMFAARGMRALVTVQG
ncbi:hypothetical protein [Streptomyces sp. NPDC005989]|uniref:hypothetical protein n=1 Tax=Streptomyces sp. NPDC005989 TaxID=3156727 RepID=UPI0033C2C579